MTAPSADPFAPLTESTLREIAQTGVVRTFPKNTVLIHEGDVGDALYIILAGRVKVYATSDDGKEFVIDFHGAGEYVGEMQPGRRAALGLGNDLRGDDMRHRRPRTVPPVPARAP